MDGLGLELKNNWQIFKLAVLHKKENGKKVAPRIGRSIDFMGFQFFKNKTILRRYVFFRACNKARNIKNSLRPNWYIAQQLLCYLGWFKHSDTYRALQNNIKDLVDVAALKKLVSAHQLKLNKQEAL